MNRIIKTAAIGASIAIVGCATIPEEHYTKPLITAENKPPRHKSNSPPSFIRTYDITQQYMVTGVNYRNLPLHQVLRAVVPGSSITPLDSSVDINMPVSVVVEPMPIDDFLDVLTNITNLAFDYQGGQISVASYEHMQWRLPAFTSKQDAQSRVSGQSSESGTSGGSGGGGSSSGERGSRLSNDRRTDEWDGLLETARQYADQVVAVRSQGIIKATGRPLAMRELDRFMQEIQATSQTIIALDVSTFEVQLTDTRNRGIDWGTLFETMVGSSTIAGAIGLGLPAPAGGSGANGSGLNINLQGTIGSNPTQLMMNLLSNYGNVQLRQQPKVTTLNGKTAFIGSGQEFGFVSEVRSTVNANLATVEPTFARVLVGIELSITPMLLDDGRVMIEVVPVISNFEGFDNFVVGGNESSQPRIALQQLATTTIARPGEPIQIGGLIQSRIENAINGIPLNQKASLGLLGYLFESESQELDRSELVIMITPNVVGA